MKYGVAETPNLRPPRMLAPSIPSGLRSKKPHHRWRDHDPRKTTLEHSGHRWLNRQRQLKANDQKTHNTQFAASAAVQDKTGNFERRTLLEARPNWACRKRSFLGIPVPVLGRK